MERKERARQEKIVHRVQIVPAQRGKNENQKEKEEQRHGREIADSSRQRTGLQFLRHLQGDVESGHQVLIVPLQLPAGRRLPFFRRRKRIVRKIEAGKIRFHQQVEVVRLRNPLPAAIRILARERVSPTVEALRAIGRVQHGLRAGRQPRPGQRLRSAERDRQRLVVQKQLHVVVHRLLRGKRQLNHELFVPRSRILKRVSSVEIHLVRAEPQQPFLPVIDVQGRCNAARVNLHRLRMSLLLRARGFLSLLLHLDGLFFLPFARDRRRRLPPRRSPRRSHAPGQSRLRVVRSVKNGGSQNGPGNRSTHKNRTDRDNPLKHSGLCPDSLRRTSNLRCQVGAVKYFVL